VYNRRLLTVLVLAWLALGIGAALLKPTPGISMTEAAQAFLKTLRNEQRPAATLPYDDARRVDWHFIPKDSRKGLVVSEMGSTQRKAARALLASAMSETGLKKSVQIMELEAVLNDIETAGKGGRWVRDPHRYYYTIFGEPKAEGTWGLSIEGHHLSLNFVVTDGKVTSHTPSMMGANPAVMPKAHGPFEKGDAVLHAEESTAFALLHMLDDAQRGKAVIAKDPPREMRSAGDAQPPDTAAVGLPAGQMTDKQQNVLRALLKAYTANMPDMIADARWAEIENAGFDKVHFAWAGAQKPGVGHYYRVQGPTFLVEFVNVQPDTLGTRANHIHCMWRDLRGDFGLKQ